jgi:hypothetical protein
VGDICAAWERRGDGLSITVDAPPVPVRVRYNGAEQVFPEGGHIEITL